MHDGPAAPEARLTCRSVNLFRRESSLGAATAQGAERSDLIAMPPGRPDIQSARGRVTRFARRHALFGAVLLAAVATRVVALLGYPRIRMIPDSWSYLAVAMRMAPPRVRPAGYSAMLWLLRPFHSLVLVAGIQHAMGVGMGIMVYALLRHRFRLPGWGASLAAIPVLLSAFAIQVEHYLISDTLFTFLLTLAVTLVLWRPVPAVWMCVLVGLLLSAATLVRSEAIPVAILILAYLVTRFRGWRTLAAGLAAGAAFAIPVLGYASWFQRENGAFEITTSTGAFLYTAVARFADCAKIKPPADERTLCLQVPVSQRNYSEYYMWHSSSTTGAIPGGEFGNLANRLATDFVLRAIKSQPLDYLAAVWHETWQTFQLHRDPNPYYSQYAFPVATDPTPPAGGYLRSGDPGVRRRRPIRPMRASSPTAAGYGPTSVSLWYPARFSA